MSFCCFLLHLHCSPKTRCIVLCGRDSLIHLFDVATMESKGVLQVREAGERRVGVGTGLEHDGFRGRQGGWQGEVGCKSPPWSQGGCCR